MELSISFDWQMSEQTVENLKSTLPFADPAIISISIDEAQKQVVLFLNPESDRALIQKKVELLIQRYKPLRAGELVKTVFDQSAQKIPCTSDVFLELQSRGDLFEHTPGVFSLSGQFLQLYRILDDQLLAFADSMGAVEVILPITTSLQTLNQSDFFKRTPQFAQFMCTLTPDADSILDFSSRIAGSDPSFDFHDYLEAPKEMCRSAICLSSYPQFKDDVLAPADFTSWTTFGKAFRNELANISSLERLYEFSMRELIFFGDREFVAHQLQKCLDWFIEKMQSWQIQGVIQTANDPFFAEKLQALQFFQLAEQSKFEIRWANPWSGNSVSVGSINNHGSHFSKAFNIRLDNGNYATTGCVGFGYERLIFLMLSQYGTDMTKWPDAAIEFWCPSKATNASE